MNIVIPNPQASTAGKKDFTSQPESGVMSQIYLPSNRDFWKSLGALIRLKDNEEIVGVTVSHDGWMKVKINYL